MNAKEKIEELLEASEDGTITAAQVTEAGLHRSVLQEFVKSGEMYRFGRGLYVRSSAWEDDFYLLQRKYGRGIYSHDTALYLLGYSDRTPAKYTMTFPKGYNAPSLKQENLIIKRVVPENYEFGRIEIESPSGNPIRVYDLERTLCDILRGSGSDVQIVGEAMKRYAASKDKNIHKLMQYADQLRVKPKVLRYMEVLLVVDGGRSVEQHRPQILLDVADLRSVLPHTVHDKLDVAAVQLQKFALYQLGRVIVASDAERLSRRADSFQHEVYDLVQTLLVHFWVLRECVILDILPDDFTVNIYGTLFERFRSFPFQRSSAR